MKWNQLGSAAPSLLAVILSGHALAQPSCPDGAFGLPANTAGTCDEWIRGGQLRSACWEVPLYIGPGEPSDSTGPLNLDLTEGVWLPDFSAVSMDPATGSFPLVSSSIQHFAARAGAQPRAMQGTVDLITGHSLLTAVDFSLPFGTATYRHVRTHAETLDNVSSEYGHSAATESDPPQDLFWDWCGQGWSIGVSPMLLVDSSYFGFSIPAGGQRCYLLLDAHHAIPFDKSEDTQAALGIRYTAPAIHQARLVPYDPEPVTNGRPRQFIAHLDAAGLQYHFNVRYEDVYRHGSVNLHDPAGTPGTGITNYNWGTPYYAFCDSITDQNGNRIKIEYADPDATQNTQDSDSECTRCCQNCREKGMVRRVLLQSQGGAKTHWTLLFTHRSFRGSGHNHCRAECTQYADLVTQHAVHSVHVYRNSESGLENEFVLPASARTLPSSIFDYAGCLGDGPGDTTWTGGECEDNDFAGVCEGLERLMSVDVIEDAGGWLQTGQVASWTAGNTNLNLRDWEYEVKYLYADASDVFDSAGDWSDVVGLNGWFVDGGEPGYLLSAQVKHRDLRDGVLSETASANTTIYKYVNRFDPGHFVGDHLKLSTVFEHSSLGTTLEALERAETVPTAGGSVPYTTIEEHWPLSLLYIRNGSALPREDGTGTTPLYDWATSHYHHWDTVEAPQTTPYGTFDGFYASGTGTTLLPFRAEIEDDFINLDRLVSVPHGVHVLSERNGGANRYFKMYRFIRPPAGIEITSDFNYGWSMVARRAVFHEPFAYVQPLSLLGSAAELPTSYDDQNDTQHFVPLASPMWITVIDEYPSEEACRFQYSGSGSRASINGASSEGLKPLSRRVVQMNRAGFILKDRTWNLESGEIESDSGIAEEFEYDTHRRITEHRTFGWGTSQNTSPTTSGLIESFEYPTAQISDEHPAPTTPSRVWIRKGTDGTPRLLRQNVFYSSGGVTRNDLLTHEIVFTSPTQSAIADPDSLLTSTPAGVEWTIRQYTLETATGDELQPVQSAKTIRPEIRRSPGSTDKYYAVEYQLFDHGKEKWRVYGSAKSLGSWGSEAGDQIAYDYHAYDDYGLLVGKVIDAQTSFDPDGGASEGPYGLPHFSVAATYPLGQRSQPHAPLNYATRFISAPYLAVNLVSFPNGRYELLKRGYSGWNASERLHTVIFHDLVPVDSSSFRPLGQVDYSVVVDGAPTYSQTGLRSSNVNTSGNWTYTNEGTQCLQFDTLLSSLQFDVDSGGNPTKIDARAGTATGTPDLSVEMRFGRVGELQYQQDPAGNITHTLHTPRGQVERIFKGTKDNSPFWGGTGTVGTDDDMYLAEGRVYGNGVNDALQVTQVRRFRERLSDQYEPPADNTWQAHGIPEKLRYDWRMRPVVAEHWSDDAQATAPETSTYTYLDHAGRIRFVATFAGAGPAGNTTFDPATHSDSFEFPSDFAHQLLSQSTTSLRPLRLTESVYNARGLVEEQRSYNVADTASAPGYLATLTFYDHAGRAIWSRSPNGGVQTTVYDAIGRAISTSLWAGSPKVEVSRVETAYDGDGNASEITSWERLHDASSSPDTLEVGTGTANNAVRSRTLHWYDVKRRVIATAEIGTADASDRYVLTTSFPERPSSSPCVYDEPGEAGTPLTGFNRDVFDGSGWTDSLRSRIRISCFQYDAGGRKIREVLPNGSVTSYTYDGLGQLTRMVENADAAAVADRRQTCYHYANGKLIGIANVVPDNENAIPWGGVSTADSQVTAIDYVADIVDENLTVISKSYEYPGLVVFPYDTEVIYPVGLRFQYYPDGLLASRSDQRGVKFVYKYDALTRLVEIDADYSAMGGTPPPDRVTKVTIGYDALDRPVDVRSYAGTALLAHTPMEYDARGNLKKQRQRLGQEATSTSPTVEYTWAYEPLSSSDPSIKNYERLTEIKYPLNAPVGLQKRKVTYGYGTADSINDVLSRAFEVKHVLGSTTKGLASYTYSGSSRVVTATQGDASALTQSVAASGTAGYPGLDMFGRLKDLHFKRGTTTVFQAESTYDTSGNRITSRIVRDVGGSIETNQASALYGYSLLDQLVSCQQGQLLFSTNQSGVSVPEIATSNLFPATRTAEWFPDRLGNLVGRPAQGQDPARAGYEVTDQAPSEQVESFYHLTHDVEFDNRLEIISENASGWQVGASFAPKYDAANNLVLDQLFYYEYDAWNRPIRISARGNITAVNGAGMPTTGTAGGWLVRFAYDGLGRLVAVNRPDVPLNGNPREIISEFFYDGIRRIQERTWGYTIEEEEGGSGEGGSGYSGVAGGSVLPPPSANRATREYLHGPGYVHHVLAQVNPQNNVLLVIQDQSEDVVALTDASGNALEQRTYDPYGQLVRQILVNPTSSPHDPCAIGHQGLFSYRLDLDSVLQSELEGFTSPPALTTLSEGIYYNFNRFYSPRHQRFLQRDMNATGTPSLEQALLGSIRGPMANVFDGNELFGDGANLFAYLRMNPNRYRDPLGEFSLADMGTTAGVSGLVSGLINGAMQGIMNPDKFMTNFAKGFAQGYVAGYLGGGLGYLANSAFAASAAGLWGALTARAAVGAVDGGVTAFGLTYQSTRDLQASLWSALDGALFGAATGGIMGMPTVRNLFVPLKARLVLAKLKQGGLKRLPGFAKPHNYQNVRGVRLPPGKYKTYDIDPAPAAGARNAERIIIEQNTLKAYYTPDHYKTCIPIIE